MIVFPMMIDFFMQRWLIFKKKMRVFAKKDDRFEIVLQSSLQKKFNHLCIKKSIIFALKNQSSFFFKSIIIFFLNRSSFFSKTIIIASKNQSSFLEKSITNRTIEKIPSYFQQLTEKSWEASHIWFLTCLRQY